MIFPCLRNIFFIFMLSGKFVNATDKPTGKITLSFEDLKYFLNSIDNILLFTEHNTTVLHWGDFQLGVFFLNVNVKTILRNNSNFAHVPQEIDTRLGEISRRLDRLLLVFNTTSSEVHSQKARLIYRLFTNATRWVDHLPRFYLQYKTLGVMDDNPVQFAEMYRDYETYSSAVMAVDKWEPTPEMSGLLFQITKFSFATDECFLALSSYEYVTQTKKLKLCELPMFCENILKTGTDFGYALSHRILLLAMARAGMDCALVGKMQDEELNMELCQEAYYEGRFIAMNGYRFIELMMEFVVGCSMLGHTEFLRRDWLEELVRHQTTAGCFFSPLDILEKNATKVEQRCDMHLTGVSVAAIGFAVRWILENEYAQESTLYDTKMLTLPFLRRLYEKNSRFDQVKNSPGARYLF